MISMVIIIINLSPAIKQVSVNFSNFSSFTFINQNYNRSKFACKTTKFHFGLPLVSFGTNASTLFEPHKQHYAHQSQHSLYEPETDSFGNSFPITNAIGSHDDFNGLEQTYYSNHHSNYQPIFPTHFHSKIPPHYQMNFPSNYPVIKSASTYPNYPNIPNYHLAFPSSLPSDFSANLSPNFPQNVPSDFSPNFPQNVPQHFPQNIPSDFRPNFPQNIPSDFPQNFPQNAPQHFPPNFPSDFSPNFSPNLPLGYPHISYEPNGFPLHAHLTPSPNQQQNGDTKSTYWRPFKKLKEMFKNMFSGNTGSRNSTANQHQFPGIPNYSTPIPENVV